MTSELSAAPEGAGGKHPWTSVRATVFGLDVRADDRLYFLRGASELAPTGRVLDVEIAAEPPGWSRGEQLCEQREADGSVSYRIEADPRAGYLISGPEYGCHLLSADGSRLVCSPGVDPAEVGWQRLLIAQALPFAALLHGLEIFHASAVALDGRAVAFLGTSRAGKTSMALELCRRGASFLADDVLAVERVEDRLICQPGTPVAGVDRDETERLRRSGLWPEQDVLATNERELLLPVACAGSPAPLGALFFLERTLEGPAEPRFEAVTDPRLLLAATFNFVLTTPERLGRLLDICALAAAQRVERVLIGPDADPPRLGEAVAQRLRAP